jgi:hypothetical protein
LGKEGTSLLQQFGNMATKAVCAYCAHPTRAYISS